MENEGGEVPVGGRGSAGPAWLPGHLCQSPAQGCVARPNISSSWPETELSTRLTHTCLHLRHRCPAGRNICPPPSALCSPHPAPLTSLSPCVSLTVSVDSSVFLNALRVHLLNLSGAGLNLEVLGPSTTSTNPLGLGYLSEPSCSICEMGWQRSQSAGQVGVLLVASLWAPGLMSSSPCL